MSQNISISLDASVPSSSASAPDIPSGQNPERSAPQGGPAPAPQEQPAPADGNPLGEVCVRFDSTPFFEAAEGIRFDFNDGLRMLFPQEGGPWRLIFKDLDTGVILFANDVQPGTYVSSLKKFYVRFGIEIFHRADLDAFDAEVKKNPYLADDASKRPKPFFTHEFDCAGKVVMVQQPLPTIGDTLAWFPYAHKFRRMPGCRRVAVLLPHLADLFRSQYPEITFITKEEVPNWRPYANYNVCLYFRGDVDHQPVDFRYCGLHRTAGYILGVDPDEELPRLDLSAPRVLPYRYVAISAQSTSQCKYWNNPMGWHEVIEFLHKSGYRVVCIDRDRINGRGIVWNHIPWGVEDLTGNFPLQQRVDIIKDADFFIGVSSGISWLAWACRVPVVMISGFTNPNNEFHTPYRVINYHTCNSCWNDTRIDFDHFDFLWCPRHKGTDRQFECSKLITSEQVISTIKKIPVFQEFTHGGAPAV
ncbi:MAG: autotransporter strand-loop-strand O-heptosyltransferase [Mailhella sp.]|nr:autotransporter strand-loop-strand O-heptosyltransferase [Mailhella sp.]